MKKWVIAIIALAALLVLAVVINYFQTNWERVVYYESWNVLGVYHEKWWKVNWDYIMYFEDWTVREEWQYKNEIEDWKFTYYFPDWRVQCEEYRENWDVINSICYYIDWTIKQEYTWWMVTWYFRNWQIDFQGRDVNEQRVWTWKWYNEDWEQIAELEYKDWLPWNWTYVMYDYTDDENEYGNTIKTLKWTEIYENWEMKERKYVNGF
jgi:hypothetical protein